MRTYNNKRYKKYYSRRKKHINEQRRQRRKENPEISRQSCYRGYLKSKVALHELKINGCAICGYNKCDCSLHFHHVIPEDKKFIIGIGQIGRANLIEELNKCVLLCSNCHGEIEQKNKEAQNENAL